MNVGFKFIYFDLYASSSQVDPDSDWLPQLEFNGGDPSAVTPTPKLTASSSYSNFDSIPSVASFNERLKALHPQVGNATDINYLKDSIRNQVKV